MQCPACGKAIDENIYPGMSNGCNVCSQIYRSLQNIKQRANRPEYQGGCFVQSTAKTSSGSYEPPIDPPEPNYLGIKLSLLTNRGDTR